MAANTLAWDKALAADPRGVIENSIAAGPGRDAILAEAESGAGTSGSSETFLQLRGFRLLAYDGSTAMVDLALQAADGTYVHLAYELVWEDGDWRLRLSPDGSLPPAATLPDLTGYVRWAGA